MSKKPTQTEKAHMQAVSDLSCVACIERGQHETVAEIHHCGTGAGGRRNHMNVVPLCPHDHRFANSVNKLGKYRREIEARWLEYVAEHCACTSCKRLREIAQ